MTPSAHEDRQRRLDESALQLFDRLAALHVSAVEGAQREFLWTSPRAFGGAHEELVMWMGVPGRGGEQLYGIDGYDMQELKGQRLLIRTEQRNHYRIPRDAIEFYRWRQSRGSPEPVRQVERSLLRMVDDDGFTKRHRLASENLRAAFDRLWVGDLDERAVIDIGGALRSALAAIARDIVGYDGTSPEYVAPALRPWLDEQEEGGALPPRQAQLLHDLTASTARVCQRLNHLHDERTRGEREPTWEEVRRAVFLTAVVCYELDSVAPV